MNRVAVSTEGIPLPGWNKSLKKFAVKALREIGKDNWDLSILLCNDAVIAGLNSRFRGKNQATDVLSFVQAEGKQFPGVETQFLPGDIVISFDSMRRNALKNKISEDEELRRLLIHGILHLNGMNHLSNRKNEPMLLVQEQILSRLAGERIMEHDA